MTDNLKIELKPDVIEFLEHVGTIIVEDDVRSFIVGPHKYTPTEKEYIFDITYAKPTKLQDMAARILAYYLDMPEGDDKKVYKEFFEITSDRNGRIEI